MSAEAPQSQVFEAVLYPNPPLGAKGTFILFVAVAAVSFALGIAFVQAGAWPVAGYFGLDIVLLAVAFRVCTRRSRRSETIRLDEKGLSVVRVSPGGRSAGWRFEPYWVRVSMDDPPSAHSQLVLSQGQRRLPVGEFLTPGERLELATALRHALCGYR